ncbi:mesotocin receptor [Procambarus clarkii]|uniref:mesotocin receptor n=1 Tax=Procambarus clarkii TaxID=6728 RepID=UPI0037443726
MFTWLTFYILLLPSLVITFCYASIVRVVFRQSSEQRLQVADGYTVLRKTTLSSQSISRAKIKTVKMTLSIILTFVACWTPYFVVHNIRIWSDYQYNIPEPVIVLAETIALVNSVMNPVLYGCFNLRVKQGLKDVCWRANPAPTYFNVNSAFHSSSVSRSGSSAVVRYNSAKNTVKLPALLFTDQASLHRHFGSPSTSPRGLGSLHNPSTVTSSTSCVSLNRERLPAPRQEALVDASSASEATRPQVSISCHDLHCLCDVDVF